MSRNRFLPFACAMIVAAPLAAQTAVPQTPAAPETPDADKLVCRRMEPKTGSIMLAKKVCHTKSEWQRIASEGQEQMRKMQDSGWGGAPER